MTSPALGSPWAEPVATLMTALGTSLQGLSPEAARAVYERDGANRLGTEGQTTSTATLALRQFKNPMGWLLIFAAAVSAIAGEWTDAIVAVSILLLGALLGFFQERKATRAIEALRARLTTKITVRRGGADITCGPDQVVVGDLVLLRAGSLVPADAVVVEAKDCFVNQALLTGETYPAEKDVAPSAPDAGLSQRANMVFAGTSVRTGTASVVVVGTGRNTELGRLAGHLGAPSPETEFDSGLRHFGYLLTRVMFVLVLVVFAGSMINEKPVAESLLFAIALAVGLAPEMLPAVLGLTLSHGARAMAQQGVLVRHLNSIENLGSMNVLWRAGPGSTARSTRRARCRPRCWGSRPTTRPASRVFRTRSTRRSSKRRGPWRERRR